MGSGRTSVPGFGRGFEQGFERGYEPGARQGFVRLRRVAALTVAAALPILLTAPAAHADAVRDAQWPIAFLNLPQAWKTTKGAGVTVAVLDTGVVGTRADLAGQVTAGPDLVGGKEKPGDPQWGVHGTGMASVIAGHGHGPGNSAGIMGVAPEAKILSVRVIRDDEDPDRGLLELSHTPISEGIRYAVDHGAQVISMSLGGTVQGADSDTTHEADAVRYALAHGVSIVVAAGNGGRDPARDVTEYPAGERGVIGVAAVDRHGVRASFSSTGWDVAVAAPASPSRWPCRLTMSATVPTPTSVRSSAPTPWSARAPARPAPTWPASWP
ncbi:S8 family serine peptidase [Catenulispora yoronensis]